MECRWNELQLCQQPYATILSAPATATARPSCAQPLLLTATATFSTLTGVRAAEGVPVTMQRVNESGSCTAYTNAAGVAQCAILVTEPGAVTVASSSSATLRAQPAVGGTVSPSIHVAPNLIPASIIWLGEHKLAQVGAPFELAVRLDVDFTHLLPTSAGSATFVAANTSEVLCVAPMIQNGSSVSLLGACRHTFLAGGMTAVLARVDWTADACSSYSAELAVVIDVRCTVPVYHRAAFLPQLVVRTDAAPQQSVAVLALAASHNGRRMYAASALAAYGADLAGCDGSGSSAAAISVEGRVSAFDAAALVPQLQLPAEAAAAAAGASSLLSPQLF